MSLDKMRTLIQIVIATVAINASCQGQDPLDVHRFRNFSRIAADTHAEKTLERKVAEKVSVLVGKENLPFSLIYFHCDVTGALVEVNLLKKHCRYLVATKFEDNLKFRRVTQDELGPLGYDTTSLKKIISSLQSQAFEGTCVFGIYSDGLRENAVPQIPAVLSRDLDVDVD